MFLDCRKISRIAGVSLVHLTILISSLDSINAANIIAWFPIEIRSSVIFSEAIVNTLAAAGHDVTYVTSVPPNKYIENCTIINYQSDFTKHHVQIPDNLINTGWYTHAKYWFSNQKEKFCFSDGVNRTVDHLKSLKKKYDLLIIPLTFFPKCFYPIAQEFNAPVIGTNVLGSYYYADELVGNPRNLASISADFKNSFFSAKVFWDRLWNLADHIVFRSLIREMDSVLHDARFKRHFPNFDIDNLPKLSLLINNNHPSIFLRPFMPNTIDVGGLHISAARDLPQNIKTFLDEAEHGAILFSLGSLVSSGAFDSKMAQMCLNVFARLPERVIWKYSENFTNTPPNVLVSKWLPQRDILAHNNVKAFITHCGFFGLQEAVYEGKPLVMLLFNVVDQGKNAAHMYKKGVGIPLQLNHLTEENLLNAIREIIDDKKYEKNMQHLSSLYKDRPMTPQETLIYWTEYVIRHKGATHLQSETVDMPFYQYFLLDILLFLLIILLILIWISYLILKIIFQYCLKTLKHPRKADSKKLN